MMLGRSTVVLLAGCCLQLASAPVSAAQVYRTVDEQGHVTFSDRAPADALAVELVHIELPAPAQPAALQERLSEMRETTDRMAADRRERELHRAALRAERAAPGPREQERVPQTAQAPAYQPLLLPYYQRWRTYPGRAVRYRRSFSQVPLRPGQKILQPGNAQLMRPILSSPP